MIHINNFLDKIKVLESKHERNFIMSTQEAKDLHTDITKLLLALRELSEDNSKDVTTVLFKGNDW